MRLSRPPHRLVPTPTSIILLLLPTSTLVLADYSEIYDLSAYSTARTCVQSCAYSASSFGASTFGCSQDYPATCLCDSLVEQSSVINSYVYSCAKASCSNTVEADEATALWMNYCVVNNALPTGTLAGAAPTSAATTSGTESGGATPAHTTPFSASSTSSSDNSNNNGNTIIQPTGISIILLAVICAGVPTVLFLVIFLALWCCCFRKWRAAARNAGATSTLPPQTQTQSQGQSALLGPSPNYNSQSPAPQRPPLSPSPGKYSQLSSSPALTPSTTAGGGGVYNPGPPPSPPVNVTSNVAGAPPYYSPNGGGYKTPAQQQQGYFDPSNRPQHAPSPAHSYTTPVSPENTRPPNIGGGGNIPGSPRPGVVEMNGSSMSYNGGGNMNGNGNGNSTTPNSPRPGTTEMNAQTQTVQNGGFQFQFPVSNSQQQSQQNQNQNQSPSLSHSGNGGWSQGYGNNGYGGGSNNGAGAYEGVELEDVGGGRRRRKGEWYEMP